MTLLTWSLPISHSIVGASDGMVEPPRVPFETQVMRFAPCSANALYKLIGIPTTAKPPNPITDPSGISATAAAKLSNTLDLGIVPPAPLFPSYRRRPVSTLRRQKQLIGSPGFRLDDREITAAAVLPRRRSGRCSGAGTSRAPARHWVSGR